MALSPIKYFIWLTALVGTILFSCDKDKYPNILLMYSSVRLCTCFHCKRSCRQASAGSSRRCRWAQPSGHTRVSTAGCRCRQWRCPPCWAPGPGWSPSGFGSSLPAGGSCADGYCVDHFPTVHSYKNTHQRQETNIKSYLVPLTDCRYNNERKRKGIFPTSF